MRHTRLRSSSTISRFFRYEPLRSVHESRNSRPLIRPCPPSSQLITGSAYSLIDAVNISSPILPNSMIHLMNILLTILNCLFVYVWIIDCLQTFSQRTHKSNLSPLIYFNFSIFAYFYLFWLCCTYLNIYVFAVSTVQFRLKSLNNASKRSKKFEQIIR